MIKINNLDNGKKSVILFGKCILERLTMQESPKKQNIVRLVVEIDKVTRQKFKLKAMSENPPSDMKQKVLDFINAYIKEPSK